MGGTSPIRAKAARRLAQLGVALRTATSWRVASSLGRGALAHRIDRVEEK